MASPGIGSRCAAAVAVLLAAGAARAATVEYLSQENRVFVRANQASDEDTATGAPTRALRAEANGSNSEFRSTALATQNADYGDGGFLLTGRLEFEVTTLTPPADSTAGVGATAGFSNLVRFVLTEAHDYEFIQRQDADEISGSQEGEQAFNLVGPDEEVFSTNSGPREGRLEAGEYRFSYGREGTNSVVNGPENGVFRADYEVGLILTPADDGNGNGGGNPNPIPLPPAAWPGVVTLAGAIAGIWLRRRRATH